MEDENGLSCTSPGVTAIAAAFPDVGSLLAQINISLSTWFAAIDFGNIFFFSIPVSQDHQK